MSPVRPAPQPSPKPALLTVGETQLSSSPGQPVTACPVCGLAFTWPNPHGACPNRWCRRSDRAFSVVFSVGVHRGGLRQAILRYKYHGEWWWAREFALLVARFLDLNSTWFEEFEVLTGVPSYLGPGARRSWDPVGRILEELRRLDGESWAVEPGLISKVAETPPMQGLDWESRQDVAATKLRAAFTVGEPDRVAGARVVVLDDVLAEGSTLREVARALRLAGAAEVAGLVLARPTWSERGETSRRGTRT
jgi:predicted amidophosphoribosyltransferase